MKEEEKHQLSFVIFILFLFSRYLRPARMTPQTTLKPSARTLKICTGGSQERTSASGGKKDTSHTTLMMTWDRIWNSRKLDDHAHRRLCDVNVSVPNWLNSFSDVSSVDDGETWQCWAILVSLSLICNILEQSATFPSRLFCLHCQSDSKVPRNHDLIHLSLNSSTLK